jgi:hypothetical protein
LTLCRLDHFVRSAVSFSRGIRFGRTRLHLAIGVEGNLPTYRTVQHMMLPLGYASCLLCGYLVFKMASSRNDLLEVRGFFGFASANHAILCSGRNVNIFHALHSQRHAVVPFELKLENETNSMHP